MGLRRRKGLTSTTPLKRSSGLKATTGLRRGKRLNPVSDKTRGRQLERRDRLAEAFGPRETWACTWRAVTAHAFTEERVNFEELVILRATACFGFVNGHEIIKRSAWAEGATEPSNIALLCNRHNDWCEDHPEMARRLGLVRSAWERSTTGTEPAAREENHD